MYSLQSNRRLHLWQRRWCMQLGQRRSHANVKIVGAAITFINKKWRAFQPNEDDRIAILRTICLPDAVAAHRKNWSCKRSSWSSAVDFLQIIKLKCVHVRWKGCLESSVYSRRQLCSWQRWRLQHVTPWWRHRLSSLEVSGICVLLDASILWVASIQQLHL